MYGKGAGRQKPGQPISARFLNRVAYFAESGANLTVGPGLTSQMVNGRQLVRALPGAAGGTGSSVYRARTEEPIPARYGYQAGSGYATLYTFNSPPTMDLNGGSVVVYNTWQVSIPSTADIAVYKDDNDNYFVISIECSVPIPLTAGESSSGGTSTSTSAGPDMAVSGEAPADTPPDGPLGDGGFNTGTSTSTDTGPGNFLL